MSIWPGHRLARDCRRAWRRRSAICRCDVAGAVSAHRRAGAGRAPRDAARPIGVQELRRWSRRAGHEAGPRSPAFFAGQPGAVVLCRDRGAARLGGGDLARAGAGLCRARSGPRSATSPDDEVCRTICWRGTALTPAIDRGMLTAAETYADNLEEAVARRRFRRAVLYGAASERFWGQDRLRWPTWICTCGAVRPI